MNKKEYEDFKKDFWLMGLVGALFPFIIVLLPLSFLFYWLGRLALKILSKLEE